MKTSGLTTIAVLVWLSVRPYVSVAFAPILTRSTGLNRITSSSPTGAASGPRIIKDDGKLHMASSLSYQALMEKIPSSNIIRAVESAPNGKVVASDVATSAGVSLSQARKDLTALASLTRGDIAVSNDGELIYTFPKNINGVLSSNSAKFRVIETFNKAKPVLFYLLRVSFGVVLLASLAAIFSTILFISASSSSDSDNRRRDDRGFGGRGGMSFGGGYNPWFGPSPFDFFYYRPYYGYYGARPGERQDPDEMGFLESTFSYIFGDGNPNEQVEEERLALAANLIRQNKGAVTAEQLAPFCDDAPDVTEDRAYVDESFVLPIVTQLNGEPRVTEDGDIVYIFPELQISAVLSSSPTLRPDTYATTLKRAGLSPEATAREINTLLRLNGVNTQGALEKKDLIQILEKALPPPTSLELEERNQDDPSMLQEKEYKFSLAPSNNRFLAAGLGVVNLLGALYLGGQLNFYANYGIKLPEFFGVVQSLYPGLLTYAVLFNAIPIIRSFWIKQQNGQIQERNRRRRLWKTALDTGVGSVSRKLKAAKKFGTQLRQLDSKDIYFDSSKGMEDIEMKREKDALDDFDKLLG